jgi:hypothetical protein
MVTSTAPLYVPGRKIICTTGEIALEFHTRGWYPPESDRIWIDGVEGELRFMVRRPATAYSFSAEVSPFLAPPHSLEIFFNYFRIDYFEVAARGELKVELPAEVFILRTCIIRLHCRTAAVGHTLGLDESRRLGIALHSWMLA